MRIKRAKRFMAFLTAAVLTASTMTVNVFADEADNTDSEYSYTDPYVLAFMGSKVPNEYRAYQSFWFSPHQSTFRNVENEEDVTTPWSNILLLYNTEAQEPIPAYCLDMVVDGERGYDYRRLNLEDSGYYSVSDAGRLRAIMNNSFPVNEEASVIENAANKWLKENEMGEITNLTGAEVLSATQYAIWSLANAGDGYLDNTPYVGTTLKPSWTYLVMFPGRKGDVTINESNKANPLNNLVDMLEEAQTDDEGNNITASNITLLSEYLLNLEPQAAKDIVISNASFESADITFKMEEDGTYTAKADVKINATINENDELKLTIKYGELSRTVALTAGGAQTITLPGLPAEAKADNLTLEINGYQTAADIFMFDAVENRGSSQTMIAYDDSRLPVHAEIQVGEKERILNFYKTTKIAIGVDGNGETVYSRLPLSGITFDIYFVADLDDYVSGAITLPETIDIGSLGDPTYHYPEYTVTTDESGKASISLSKNGLPDGVYVVKEREHVAIEKPVDPFYIMLPATNDDGDGWVYEITVEPKNTVESAPEIKKDVNEIENNSDTVNAGEEFTWIVRGDVPSDIKDAKSYVITDTLDYRLTYAENLVVKVEPETAEADNSTETENVLIEGTDYALTVTDKDISDDTAATKEIVVSLTASGMRKVAKIVGDNSEDYEVRVYFNTIVDEDASMGTNIPNQATLNYTNSVNFDFEVDSDIPEVYTCGINIYKYDVKDTKKALQGAEFMVARKATAAEIADQNVKTSALVTGSGTIEEVVYVKFYNNAELSGDRVNTVVTGEDGKAVIYGLEEVFETVTVDGVETTQTASYYLVETKAPSGYNLLSYPVTVKLDRDSHLEANRVEVANSNAFTLPTTGGVGTTIFTVSGMSIVAVAVFLMIRNRRKEDELA